MNKSLRRRVAAVATTATVGGLLLPFLAAGSALAATPTTITATPSAAIISTNTTAPVLFTITTDLAPTNRIYSQVTAGPDIQVAGTRCAAGATTTTFVCTVTPNGTAAPGSVDTVQFFYDTLDARTGVYGSAATNPIGTTSTLTVAGTSKIVLSPVNSSATTLNYNAFTATATDSLGKPVKGDTITLTAIQQSTAASDLDVRTAAAAAQTGSPAGSSNPATKSATSAATPASGITTFYVSSKNPGTIALNAVPTSTPSYGSPASVVVAKTLDETVTAVTATPSTQRVGISTLVTTVFNLKNKLGGNVTGVTPVIGFTPGSTPVSVASTISFPSGAASDTNGNVTATYTASGTSGQDSLQGFVNYPGLPNGAALDASEPSATATVNVGANDLSAINDSTNNAGLITPLSTNSNTITYTVVRKVGTSSSLAGYNVVFAPSAATGTFTLDKTNAVTDINGQVSVIVTNANPAAGNTVTVTASVAGLTRPTTVTYAIPAIKTLAITPYANTGTSQGSASFSATATDQFGAPFATTFDWTVTGRNTTASTTSSPTFSYTDKGVVGTAGVDRVVVTANKSSATTALANQYWITGAVTATQANIDLGTAGTYSQSTPTSPVIASGFTTSIPTPPATTPVAVTADGTAVAPTAVQRVLVKLTDSVNNRLYGKSVTFSSSGVGVFTDVQGKPLGGTVTSLVADQNATTLNPNTATVDSATAFVRSTQGGTQTITATVDGISTTATVTYSGQYLGVTPVRVLDTRSGQGALQVSGTTAPAGPLAPNTSYSFSYKAAGMPVGASAYGFNVTAIKPSGLGNLRVAPGLGTVAPATSLVNYQSGNDVANFVIVPNGGAAVADFLQLYSAASSVDVAIDFVGYYPAAGSVTATTPSRIADTRVGGTPIGVGETRSFQVAGLGGLPATSAKAVALNVTVVNPKSLGNLRIFADGDALPTTSNINYIPGQDKSAFVIVNLPANGKISVYSAGTPVDVAIDAYASFDKVTSNVVTMTPTRILDTRPSNSLKTDEVRDVQVAGVAGVPANAQSVLVSVTAIHTTGSLGSGNLAAFPSGGAVPIISTVNYVPPASSDVANFAIVKLGANGKISVDTQGSPTDVAIDVLGYIPAS